MRDDITEVYGHHVPVPWRDSTSSLSDEQRGKLPENTYHIKYRSKEQKAQILKEAMKLAKETRHTNAVPLNKYVPRRHRYHFRGDDSWNYGSMVQLD